LTIKIANMASPSDRIVIIGAGVFGLSLAYQLASEGNQNVMVIDRHVPPVSYSDL
jgi:glycine/D-amino acid oxidase-like deaminating enzyme